MAARLSRVSIVVKDRTGAESQGSLSAAAVGFALHQTWVYVTVFGGAGVFSESPFFQWENFSWLPMPLVFFVSSVALVVLLLAAGLFAQKAAGVLVRMPVVAGAAAVVAVGTLVVFVAGLGVPENAALSIAVGVALGAGSAVLTLFWGISLSRMSLASIALNVACATVGAVVLYACLVHLAPLDLHPFIITCLPLLEIPFARLSTPRHFADLRDVPVFANVPVRGGSLSVRLAASMLLFGLALGMLSSMTAVSILRGQDAAVAMVAILLASVPTAAFLMLVLRHGGDGRWDFLMRPLLLLVALTSFAAPLLMDENPLVALFVRYAGYLCFEASMWVFFAGVAQGFRLSPVFMVGVGRGALSLGTLAGMCLMASHSTVESLLPYGWPGVLILVLLGLIAGYVMLPRFDAMRKAVAKGSGVAGAECDEGTGRLSECDEGVGRLSHGENQAECGEQAASRNMTNDLSPRHDDASSDGLDVPSATASLASPDAAARYDDALKEACERIASRYLLSQRQTEVLYLLARGHTAPYIQDKLCVTLSTAKSHIYNIYKKLDIHKQHELLSMVESEIEDHA